MVEAKRKPMRKVSSDYSSDSSEDSGVPISKKSKGIKKSKDVSFSDTDSDALFRKEPKVNFYK